MYRRTVLRSSPTLRAIAETVTPCRCRSRIMTTSPSRTNDAPLCEKGPSSLIGTDRLPGPPWTAQAPLTWGKFNRHIWGVFSRHSQIDVFAGLNVGHPHQGAEWQGAMGACHRHRVKALPIRGLSPCVPPAVP